MKRNRRGRRGGGAGGAGLALLAVASLYQYNKRRKRISVPADNEKGKRRNPVQVLKDAQLKRKTEAELNQQEALVIKQPAIKEAPEVDEIESVELARTEANYQVELEEEVVVRSFSEVLAEVRARAEQRDPDEAQEAEVIQETQDISNLAQSPTVYLVGNGRKYHLTKECRGVKKDAELSEMTLVEATEKGFSLCGWEDK